LYFPQLVVVAWSSEPESKPQPPVSLKDAVVQPMLAMFKKKRAVEVLSFIVLFKLGENLATALIRPFLIEKGFTPEDVGIVVTTLNLFATVGGTVTGGVLTDKLGMGRTLWISGALQALGCLAYAVVDQLGGPTSTSPTDLHRLAMYAAVGGEQFFQGMGGGALGVLMLRLTAKEFSATQFALLSSLMALPRVIVGPFAGVLAYSLGWSLFFVVTVPIALPGLWMLSRFVPFGAREAVIEDATAAENAARVPVTRGALLLRALVVFLPALAIAIAWSALLGGMADSRKAILGAARFADVWPTIVTNVQTHFTALIGPATAAQWLDLAFPSVFAALVAAAACAIAVARRGLAR
jgi:PAT family beta-lactamase induction signal transducer AmpG